MRMAVAVTTFFTSCGGLIKLFTSVTDALLMAFISDSCSLVIPEGTQRSFVRQCERCVVPCPLYYYDDYDYDY